MNNTNFENGTLKFAILLILMYNILRTLEIEYIRLRLVISSLVKYSLYIWQDKAISVILNFKI